MFNRLLDQLGEPSRFLLTELIQSGVTVGEVLAATGLTAEQVERLLCRLQQLGLFQANDTPTDLGRQLGRALTQGLHGAEASLWLDRLNMGEPVVLLSSVPLRTADVLAAGIPRITAETHGRSEVFTQQQRLLQWLGRIHRPLPLQPLIETLWGDAARLPEGTSAAKYAWELELPLDQGPGQNLWLPVCLPMTDDNGALELVHVHTDRHPRLRLPALDCRIDYRAPQGIAVDQPLPASEHHAYCLVSNREVSILDLEDGVLAPKDVDWPLQPVLERIDGSTPVVPAYLERSVSIRRRSRPFKLNLSRVLEQLRRQQADHLYSPNS